MRENYISKAAQVGWAFLVSKIQNLQTIRGFHGLLDHQKQLKNARFARAVCSEEPGDWSEAHFFDALPRFEIAEAQFGAHSKACCPIYLQRSYLPMLLQPQFLEPVLHFLEMEVERAEFFEFAFLEMSGNRRVGLQLLDEIRVVAAGVFDFPRLHRCVLNQLVGIFAGQAFLDERKQNGLAVPHAERKAEIFLHVLG